MKKGRKEEARKLWSSAAARHSWGTLSERRNREKDNSINIELTNRRKLMEIFFMEFKFPNGVQIPISDVLI